MSNEDTERRIVFIIEQQALFISGIQQLRKVQVQTEQIVARLAGATLEGFKDVNVKINALVDCQIRTDENLRNLVVVVDRYFTEGRNGR